MRKYFLLILLPFGLCCRELGIYPLFIAGTFPFSGILGAISTYKYKKIFITFTWALNVKLWRFLKIKFAEQAIIYLLKNIKKRI